MGSGKVWCLHPSARVAMQELAAELARVTDERRRLQRQAQKDRARHSKQREHALLVATIAFCHEPNDGHVFAEATLRKYARVFGEDVAKCTAEIEDRFLKTPVDTLAQWLDWSEDMPRGARAEAQRLVEEARLLRWVGEQNRGQGVAPPPQFVWEKRCSMAIDCHHGEGRAAGSWRPARSAAAKKWLQRFRRRWNLTLGRLPTQDILPAETMQSKVRAREPKKHKHGSFPHPILRSAPRPLFWGRVQKNSTRWESEHGTHLVAFSVQFLEATAVWQWFRFLRSRVPPNQQVLRLNLDETSIRFWYQPRMGLRPPKRQMPRTGFTRQASRGQLRKAFSHVAIICDDASLQPHLPQVLLVNERTVSIEQLRLWRSLPGSNAQLWRRPSAWINDKVFAQIVRTLGKVLQQRAKDRQAILLLDAHVCHFSLDTLAACRAFNIWPVIIPARMTSLLQPLDTHVFARFKMFLRTYLHQVMLTGANVDLTSEQVIDALLHSIKGVLQRHAWGPAFDKNGFGDRFQVRKHLCEVLSFSNFPVIESNLPAYAQFVHCFPARKHIPFMQLLCGVLPPDRRGPKRAREETAGDVLHDVEPRPWKERLRPRQNGRAVVAQAAAAPVAAAPMPPSSSAAPAPAAVPLLTLGGQPLPSLRRLHSRVSRPSM